MNDFTASNGAKVQQFTRSLELLYLGNREAWLEPWAVDALREFFLHERDEELGRWRWPENPDFVAYFNKILGYLTVTWEPQGGSTRFERGMVPDAPVGGRPADVARAYFEAHPEPEPKPWHDAKPGEIWAVTIGGEKIACNVTSSGPDFEPFGHPIWATIARGSDRIETARRIWPEETP